VAILMIDVAQKPCQEAVRAPAGSL